MSSVFGVGNAHFRTGGKSGCVDTVAFGAYRREVFERVGFFDEELARNQDDEFNYRVVQGGFKIFLDPAIQSDYFVRGSISKLYKQYDQYGYWKVFVNKKHGAVTTLRQLAPPLWVLFLLMGWTGSLMHP
jgi:GT2 family glycosyltransferase